MTIEEFEKLEPALARELRWFAHHNEIDGVYRGEGDRWEAHCSSVHGFDRAFEARCHESCVDAIGRKRPWVWEGHECCEQCKTDPGHRYRSVHE